jgi:hypothetical protein
MDLRFLPQIIMSCNVAPPRFRIVMYIVKHNRDHRPGETHCLASAPPHSHPKLRTSLCLPLDLDVVKVSTLVVLGFDLEDDGGHVPVVLRDFEMRNVQDERVEGDDEEARKR